MLLNPPQHTGQPHTRERSGSRTNSAKVEDPYSKGIRSSPLRSTADTGVLARGNITAISHRDTKTKVTTAGFHSR